jgi:cytochrome c oxidase assembly protein subunit 15
MTEARYIPLLHRTAQLTVAATLLLIFMGGLVTSHGAGMSVPDWPNSYGYNMFTFPPGKWVGGIFYEHTHRLMGTVVGMLAIVLTVLAWKYEKRRWLRWLATAVLGAVIFQGVLGGLRVVWVELKLAVVHACVAQAFLCLASLVAVVTSRWWIQTTPDQQTLSARVTGIAVACALAVYLQLVVGALMRHYEAGLAIPDFPLSFGKVLPPTDEHQIPGVHMSSGGFWTHVPTLWQVWLNFSHRVGALIVATLLLTLAICVFRRSDSAALRRPAAALVVLLITQVTLGILTVLWRKPADVASLHVVVGAMTLMTTFVLLVRSMRMSSPLWRNAPQGFEVRVTVDSTLAAA